MNEQKEIMYVLVGMCETGGDSQAAAQEPVL